MRRREGTSGTRNCQWQAGHAGDRGRASIRARGFLELDRLEKRFGKVVAVRDFSVEMQAGEFVTLLGPSGSGKTTTLMIVAGFVRPDAGSITLDGRSLLGVPPHDRGIGLVFQDYALFPHMTVFENVAFPLRRQSMKRAEITKRVNESLALVHLPGHERRYPWQLSGGEQQRVALARATVYNPPLLLMDEPLNALDRRLRQNLQVELRRLHRELNTSVLYITHDQEEALALSDRVVLMNEGRIQQVGTPDDIYERPRSVFAAKFLGESSFLRGRVREAGDSEVVTVELRSGLRVRGTRTTVLADGDEVVLAVRPECLEISGSADDESGIGVFLREAIYLGDSVRAHGDFLTGEPCVVRLDPKNGAALIGRAGVRVTWDADRAMVMPAGAGESEVESGGRGVQGP